jgi:hypothetical protein
MMNIMLRLGERGFGGSVSSRPLLIDLENNRWRFNLICRCGLIDIVANFTPVRSYIGVMVTGGSRTAILDRFSANVPGSKRYHSMLG